MLSLKARNIIAKTAVTLGVLAVAVLIYCDSSGLLSIYDLLFEITTQQSTTQVTTEAATTEASTTEATTTEVSTTAATTVITTVTTTAAPTTTVPRVTTDNTTKPVTTTTTQPSTEKDYTTVTPTGDKWYLTVVSRNRRLPDGYTPNVTYILASEGYSARLDSRVAPHYEDMYYAAKEDGVTLSPYSAYRTYDRQKTNYNNRIALWRSKGYSYSQAVDKTAEVILPPGSSEHNMGFAIDINGTSDDFDLTDAYAWLTKNAYKYGFILRYTAAKRSITGVVDEPWHWRYVGVETATAMRGTGMCLEEYLASIGMAV